MGIPVIVKQICWKCPNLIRQLGTQIEIEMAASRLRKEKSRGKAQPFTTVITVTPEERDYSYLPTPIIVLGFTLCNVDLVIDIGVPLPLVRSPRS